MKRLWVILLPVVILLAGFAGAVAMIKAKPAPETVVPEPVVPLVEVETVEFRKLRLTVRSQGTVTPRTESMLVPEVAGRVIAVSPSLVAGGFFERGDVLLRIDPHDYEQAVVQARANVARAELVLAQQEAEAEVAIREWNELYDGEASPLTRREPQLADARASLDATRAALSKAERDLERTRVRAPYDGRVRTKQVDVGQFVGPGNPVVTIYAVDAAEVRLPIPDEDLAYLDLPLRYRGESKRSGPRVTLTAEFAGREQRWSGRIVRSEGEIDPRSRLIHVVAQVKDPYGRGEDPDRPPLAVGMYVRAEIEGIEADRVAVVPRSALRGGTRVLVVDEDDRLRFREVDVLRATPDTAILRNGLQEGERVCISALAAVTDGMQVRTEDGS